MDRMTTLQEIARDFGGSVVMDARLTASLMDDYQAEKADVLAVRAMISVLGSPVLGMMRSGAPITPEDRQRAVGKTNLRPEIVDDILAELDAALHVKDLISPESAERVNKGDDANDTEEERERKLISSLPYLKKAALAGSIPAQLKLGHSYRYIQSIEDYTESFKWYLMAAQAGNAYAQTKVGTCYHKGWGVKQDSREALKWLQHAYDQGYTQSGVTIGWICKDMYPPDYRRAIRLLEKGAQDGNEFAQYQMGLIYQKGLGVRADLEKAKQYFQQSADQGNEYALRKVEMLNRFDKPVAGDATYSPTSGLSVNEKGGSNDGW